MNKQMSDSIDHTKDGTCSQCGKCCSAILLLSDKEIQKIKNFLKKNPEVKLVNRNNILETEFKDVCPFKTDDNKCGIYEVRPEICRRFICSQYKDPKAPALNHRDKKVINMITTFMPNVTCPNAPDLNDLNEFYKEQKKRVYGK